MYLFWYTDTHAWSPLEVISRKNCLKNLVEAETDGKDHSIKYNTYLQKNNIWYEKR
jgi:hypothetical protein